MGKGTDKLYITHSEWASEDAFSASIGSRSTGTTAAAAAAEKAAFRRLPFNHCALSLNPFREPVCTRKGTVFDLSSILTWLVKRATNPVDGSPLARADLITLHFAKNDEGEYVDPVTYKVFTNNSHIVAIGSTGNVFAYETILRLNIKAKNMVDLVTDTPFARSDLITLQDPVNVETRNLAEFAHVKAGDGAANGASRPEGEHEGIEATINTAALGSSAKILKAKEAIDRARREREEAERTRATKAADQTIQRINQKSAVSTSSPQPLTPSISGQTKARNLAHYTTGQAAASFTSTGLAPHTQSTLATLSEEDFLLRPRLVKTTGFIRFDTSVGSITLELFPEHAPRAVWNMIKLAESGYYDGIPFHRNIRNFMIQGGDPSGTGRGGSSVWKKPFVDELEGPLVHDRRGVLSMANKGADTNTSQFFITYRPCSHLDRKHTIFGRLVGDGDTDSLETLKKMESLAPDSNTSTTSSAPKQPVINKVVVLIDPFKEYLSQTGGLDGKGAIAKKTSKPSSSSRHAGSERTERADEEARQDDTYTWTGKRVRPAGSVRTSGSAGSVAATDSSKSSTAGSVGRYLKPATGTKERPDESASHDRHGAVDPSFDWDDRPAKKKKGQSGFGNFDGW